MPDDFLAGLVVEDRARMWADALARPLPSRSARWVCEVDGSVTGFVVGGPVGDDGAEGEVYSLNVDPDWWGRGHGRALLAAAADALTEAGFAEAVLWVHRDSKRSRRFYERAGWLPDGEERTVEVLGVEVPEVRYRRALA